MGLPFGLVDWFILVWILNALHILPFSFWVFGGLILRLDLGVFVPCGLWSSSCSLGWVASIGWSWL